MSATYDFLKVARSAALGVAAAVLIVAPAMSQTDPLPSWNDTAPKAAIVGFVEEVTKEIARALELSEPTVKFHLKNVFSKLGVSRRAMALAVSAKLNLR